MLRALYACAVVALPAGRAIVASDIDGRPQADDWAALPMPQIRTLTS